MFCFKNKSLIPEILDIIAYVKWAKEEVERFITGKGMYHNLHSFEINNIDDLVTKMLTEKYYLYQPSFNYRNFHEHKYAPGYKRPEHEDDDRQSYTLQAFTSSSVQKLKYDLRVVFQKHKNVCKVSSGKYDLGRAFQYMFGYWLEKDRIINTYANGNFEILCTDWERNVIEQVLQEIASYYEAVWPYTI